MIAVLDYGIGNVGSILNMLKKIGADAFLCSDVRGIESSEKLILPGVGSFDAGMQKLNKSGLVDSIKNHALVEKKPLLGICLGMQMLGLNSEEGTEPGLGLIPFASKRFQLSQRPDLRIPHMGWNIVTIELPEDSIVWNLDMHQRYYFVHSYHAICEHEEHVLMKCDYGYPFAAAVKNENIYGTQFHPEKSHKFGMALLENFTRRL